MVSLLYYSPQGTSERNKTCRMASCHYTHTISQPLAEPTIGTAAKYMPAAAYTPPQVAPGQTTQAVMYPMGSPTTHIPQAQLTVIWIPCAIRNHKL
jgi:hypothetical protein